MTLHVVQSTAADAYSLAPYLRQADRNECMAAAGHEPLEALKIGYEASEDPQTVLENGHPIAMFGVVRLAPGVGAPWLLGSGRVEERWFSFARRSRDEFARVREPWAYLTNFCDERNILHQRWLIWLGADMAERVPHYGVGQLPFWRFEFTKES